MRTIDSATIFRKELKKLKAHPDHGNLDELLEAGVAPDVTTFGTLMNKAQTEPEAARWHEEMLKAGVASNAVIADILAKKEE